MPIVTVENFTEKHRMIARNMSDPNELTGRSRNVELTRRRVQFVRENVLGLGRRFSTIVDVGCGDGSFIGALAEAGDRRVGILPTAEEIDAVRRIAAQRGYGIEVAQGLSTGLPFSDQSVDLVICNAVFLGFDSDLIDQSIREFGRVQPAGGVLYIGEIPESNGKAGQDYGSSFGRFLIWALRNKGLRYSITHLFKYLRGVLTSKTYVIKPDYQFHEGRQAFCERMGRLGYEVQALFLSSTNERLTIDDPPSVQRLDYLCVKR